MQTKFRENLGPRDPREKRETENGAKEEITREIEDWKSFYSLNIKNDEAFRPWSATGEEAKKYAQDTLTKINTLKVPQTKNKEAKLALFSPYLELEQVLNNPKFKENLKLPKEFKGSLSSVSALLASGPIDEPERYNARAKEIEPYAFRTEIFKEKFQNFLDLQEKIIGEKKNKMEAIKKATNFLESLLITLKNEKSKKNFAIYCAGTIFDPKNEPRIPIIIKIDKEIKIILESITTDMEKINNDLKSKIPQGVEVYLVK